MVANLLWYSVALPLVKDLVHMLPSGNLVISCKLFASVAKWQHGNLINYNVFWVTLFRNYGYSSNVVL